MKQSRLAFLGVAAITVLGSAGYSRIQQEERRRPIFTIDDFTPADVNRAEVKERGLTLSRVRLASLDKEAQKSLTGLQEAVADEGVTIDTSVGYFIADPNKKGEGEYAFVATQRDPGSDSTTRRIFRWSPPKDGAERRKPIWYSSDFKPKNAQTSSLTLPQRNGVCQRGWTPWTMTGTACTYRFWCFSKNQQATYYVYERRRDFLGGTLVQYCHSLQSCGC
jgi:hypothetical protein